jgi:hypothetical protein
MAGEINDNRADPVTSGCLRTIQRLIGGMKQTFTQV